MCIQGRETQSTNIHAHKNAGNAVQRVHKVVRHKVQGEHKQEHATHNEEKRKKRYHGQGDVMIDVNCRDLNVLPLRLLSCDASLSQSLEVFLL